MNLKKHLVQYLTSTFRALLEPKESREVKVKGELVAANQERFLAKLAIFTSSPGTHPFFTLYFDLQGWNFMNAVNAETHILEFFHRFCTVFCIA